MSYSPTRYWASMVTPSALARSASAMSVRGVEAPRLITNPSITTGWQGSGSKYSTSLGAE